MEALLECRDLAFKYLLFEVSGKLGKADMEKLALLMDVAESSLTPLQLLMNLRKKGVFCPLSCTRLVELLKNIDRHDLADLVRQKYVEKYPDIDKRKL